MQEAVNVLRRNFLCGTVEQLHVSAKDSCRKLRCSYDSLADCNHLVVLELLGIILCMAVCDFAVLHLNVVFGHDKLENALAMCAMLHQIFINCIIDAARGMYLPLLPESKICIPEIDSFF